MDTSVSNEFLNVYKLLSKLQDDIAKVGKDFYETTLSCDDLEEVPENLSEFNNDLNFVTSEEVDVMLNDTKEQCLVKDGVSKQKCDVPTEFKELYSVTLESGDESDKVATTQFVHDAVKYGTDGVMSFMIRKDDISDFVTEEFVDNKVLASEQSCKSYTDEQVEESSRELTDEFNRAIQLLEIPEKLSLLDNDTGFITLQDIPDDLVTSVNGQTGDVQIDIPTIPTNISAFNNDVGYITDAGVTSVNNQTGAVMVQENVLANWNATSGLAAILNKPALKRVATTGDYNDLDNTPDLTTKVDKVQSTDNAIVRFDGSQGDIQNSDVTIDDNGDIITGNSIYLTTVYLSVHTAGNSRIHFGSKENPVAYISANSAGSFGMYNEQGKGFSCQPTLNFFSTSNIDLGRAGNSWKDFYFTGLFYKTLYGYEFPDKSGTVALTSDLFSGDYNDLINKPTIPAALIQADYTQSDSSAVDYIKNKPDLTQYATVSALNSKQDALVSGTNIKTVNNQSLLGSGDITILATQVQADWNETDNTDPAYILNKPTIPTVPTNVSAFTNDAGYLTQHQDISGKYDKTGGNISGDVDIDGTLKLNIEDEDYDSAITMSARLDDNLGTVLTLTGNADSTQYKTLIRNVATPASNYDAANKKYVDDNLLIPNYHLVELNTDGSVHLKASSIVYSTISANLTNPREADYLDVLWENGAGTNQYTRFYAKAIETVEVNTGDIKFIGDIEYAGMLRRIVFTLDHNDTLTTTSITTSEIVSNKKNSVVNNLSNDYYASTNAIYNEFLRKPVTIWETTGTGLLSSEQDITANPTWQLTGLDMTPYKRVKIYTKAGKKTSGVGQNASNTPAVVLEMSLDNRAAGPTGGHFMGSAVGQKPNDANRFFTVTCAISADKTSFAVLRMSTLYGTAATANSDCNGYVFKIEGYYD